ncbi:AsnC family transcriptional regulator [Tabrizicola sp.]|jgi:DNA-binding Lrp family transcriptional regulator|uniref:Lrp/AsnC family transcriptional regulator n=1 Tax=Tabrizicola sp. TaxID=2005166 RepID=UPI001A596DF8|nr:AsnC family transcriptional regulator [Tabrizicola sp.]MBL9061865.1 Lrp/AsnC family transcriptional regulator [Tabrizicola sp.]
MRTTLPPDALDRTDRLLINRLQDGLPLVHAPFAAVAAEAGIPETEVVDRITHLREIGAITRFGPFLDAEAMGGAFCLCAMAVPEGRFDEVMTLVNAHPEVAHNYERQHKLNMWFVLACERPGQIAEAAERIEREAGLTVLRFPKMKEFFIGFRVEA